MHQAFNYNIVRATLLHGIKAAYWTIEHLDHPSPGWTDSLAQSVRISGFAHPTHRNLVRDPHTTESVQPVDPRDFDVAAPIANGLRPEEPQLLPTQWPPVPGFSDRGNQPYDEEPHRPRENHGLQAHLGTTGEGGSLRFGEFLEDPEKSDPLSDDW